MKRDPSLDALLDLNGQVLVVDPESHHWVRFVVRRVPATAAKPHGLDYALSLHGPDGERLVGFDNAHAVRAHTGPGGRRRRAFSGEVGTGSPQKMRSNKESIAHDHRHRLKTVRPYDYRDAGTLLADFWTEVDAVLKERGVVK